MGSNVYDLNNQHNFNTKSYQNNTNNIQFPGYFKNGKLNIDIFDNYVEKLVEFWFKNTKEKLTKSQIRNIYNEVKDIQNLLKRKNNVEEGIIRIKMLKSKIRYNQERDQGLSDNFANSIIEWINNIDYNEFNKYFDAFCKLFECAVGYSYKYAK